MPIPLGFGPPSPTDTDHAVGSDAVSEITPLSPPDAISVTTERLYLRMPHCYRAADAAANPAPNDQPLLRWLATVVDQAAELEALLDRFASTRDLVNPATADPGWLPWMAQLAGLRTLPVGDAAARDAIAHAPDGWQAGTKGALANAVRAVLIGERFVAVVDHYQDDPWTLEIRTRNSQTPPVPPRTTWDSMAHGFTDWDSTSVLTWDQVGGGIDPVLDAAARAKPAGYRLVHTEYEATWHTVEVAYRTWDSVAGRTWDEIGDQVAAYEASWDVADTRLPTWDDAVGQTWDQVAVLH